MIANPISPYDLSFVPSNLEIPGQLSYKEWAKNQPKEKLRLAQRAGRAAMFGAAVTIGLVDIAVQVSKHVDKLYGHSITKSVASSSTAVTPKLNQRYEQLVGKPETKTSRRHRIGATALKAASVGMHKISKGSSRVAERQAAKPVPSFKNSYEGNSNLLARAAYGYIDHRLSQAKQKRTEKAEKFDQHLEQQRLDYLEANPLVILEHKKTLFYGQTFDMSRANFRKVRYLADTKFDSFVVQPRFSEAQPDYDAVATEALTKATSNKLENGIAPLYTLNSLQMQTLNASSGPELKQATQDGFYALNSASTAIWKLGFVDYDQAEGLPRMHPDVQATVDGSSQTYDIPFDADNPFHQIISDGTAVAAGSRLRLLANPDNMGLLIAEPVAHSFAA